MSITVTLENRDQILEAMKNVRDDKSDVNWVVLGHVSNNPNKLELVGVGSDGLQGLLATHKPNQVYYSLLRTIAMVDQSSTVKFVYLHFVGEEVGIMKGRYGVVHGDILKYFQPLHVDFEISKVEEVNEQVVKEKVERVAGTADATRPKEFAIGKPEYGKNQNQKEASDLAYGISQPNSKVYGSTGKLYGSTSMVSGSHSKLAGSASKLAGSNPKLNGSNDGMPNPTTIQCDDPVKPAIQDVRNNKSLTTWVLTTFQNSNDY
jgi:drebrin-like protein